MLNVIGCMVRDHDPWLVGLSAAICVPGCMTTAMLVARSRRVGGLHGRRGLAVAAAVFGGATWSLHFVAMLAYLPGHGMAYDAWTTALSALVAMLGAYACLVALSELPGRQGTLAAGLALAAGVAGMHYLGISAMRFSGFIMLDPTGVLGSVATCAALSCVAAGRLRRLEGMGRCAVAAAWMALAICSLHFTGMSAITMAPGEPLAGAATLVGTHDLAITVGVVTASTLAAGFCAAVLDLHVSDRLAVELARVRRLANLAHEGILIDADGVVVEANDAAGRLFGCPAVELVGRVHAELYTSVCGPNLSRRAACNPGDLVPEEFEVLAANGTVVPVELSCQRIEHMGQPATAVSLRNLSERKRDEARMRHLARHDPLTDLPNRTLLRERLENALRATPGGRPQGVALLYLDLDRFKPVNDRLGHAVGDALLVEVTKRLLAQVRATDTVARVGGDEFVVLQSDVHAREDARDLAERIVATMAEPFDIHGNQVGIGVSVGVAVQPDAGTTPEELMRSADAAMYRSKGDGRGLVRFFGHDMAASAADRRTVEADLSDAVAAGQLVLHHQPVVDARTGEVTCFEALVRWDHPVRGLLQPADFIPVAEGNGTMPGIGAWVAAEACRAAAARQDGAAASINVSAAQFRRHDVVEMVRDALERSGLPAARLMVEVTEAVLAEVPDRAVATMRALQGMGVRIVLDDFGTGHSSIAHLLAFEFDRIKVDRSLVASIDTDPRALSVVNAIITLGRNLGFAMTAEGVETETQLALVRSLGVDHVQGNLLAAAAPEGLFGQADAERLRGTVKGVRKRDAA